MKRKTAFCVISLLFFSSIYSLILFKTNSASYLDLSPKVEIYQANTPVDLKNGFYNLGYSLLEGYEICVTGVEITSVKSIMPNYKPDTQTELKCTTPIILVNAEFRYTGDGEPLDGIIDLTDFYFVGTDYYINYNSYIDKKAEINKILNGNHMFSVRKGNVAAISIPFVMDISSEWALNIDYVINSSPKLLISRYPHEIYIDLGNIIQVFKDTS